MLANFDLFATRDQPEDGENQFAKPKSQKNFVVWMTVLVTSASTGLLRPASP